MTRPRPSNLAGAHQGDRDLIDLKVARLRAATVPLSASPVACSADDDPQSTWSLRVFNDYEYGFKARAPAHHRRVTSSAPHVLATTNTHTHIAKYIQPTTAVALPGAVVDPLPDGLQRDPRVEAWPLPHRLLLVTAAATRTRSWHDC